MIFDLNKITKLIKKNAEFAFVLILLAITIASTTFYNNKKILINKNYKDVINNIYFKKSLNFIFDNLTPRYKSIDHKISDGETFDKILNDYSVPANEIIKLKKKLKKVYNLNDLKTNFEIKFIIDQSNNKEITSFIFPLSRTKKILLTKNLETNSFEKKIIITNLNRKIIFKESKISKSLYRTAMDLNIQPNIIIEFARIYGFQVDFQRDIRKNDNFQIIYEVFEDDNGKIYETGKIIFADLKLSGINNSLYYFSSKGEEGYTMKMEEVLKRL